MANEKKRYTNGVKITVSVRPNARKDQIEMIDDTRYMVRVKATPVKGKANKALIELFANHLNIARSLIIITSGFSSCKKIMEIR